MTSSRFWQWFSQFAPELADLCETHVIVERIYGTLQTIDKRLAVEVSEPDSSCQREVIISANGHPALFCAVDELVGSAPEIPGWRFVALRPPRGFNFVYRQDGNELRPATWSFLPMRDEDNNLGLRILIPGRRCVISDEVLRTIIETGVGEKAFCEIRYLEYTQSPDALRDGSWLGLESLSAFLSWQASRGPIGSGNQTAQEHSLDSG